jgi:2-polyprenyl-6-methoxyphenol hydroxylase-like FAD-dependent oxidoreductase
MILIAGGGIGGLTLGCALSHARKPFRIFERAVEIRPVGAGIALSPNAFQALAHIAMDDRVRRCGWDMEVAELCNSKGRILIRAPVPKVAGGLTKAMTRTNLHQALIEGLGANLEMGRAVQSYQSKHGGVRVRMADGEEIEAELLVGADGLHSSVRRAMRGNETLRYSGQTSWRGLVTGVELQQQHVVTESWGPGERFGIVPLGADHVYWFAVVNAPAGERDKIDVRRELQSRFAGWHKPIEQLLAMTPTDQIIRTDIFDRPPISTWVDGRALLLGDAAHPMTPNLGMGACQAIEDAVVLSHALSTEPNIEAALLRYQTRRIPRANSFVNRCFRFGQVAHASNPLLRWLRDQTIRTFSLLPHRLISSSMARDYRFHV